MTFWYGLSFDDVATMPTTAIWAYLERLPGLKAEMRLMMAEATSVPHLKTRDRRVLLKRLSQQMTARRANPPRRIASPGQLALMGIGYRKVSVSNNR